MLGLIKKMKVPPLGKKFGVSKELFGDDRETALSNIHWVYELGSHDVITVYSLDSVNVHGTLHKPDKDAFLHFRSQWLAAVWQDCKNLIYCKSLWHLLCPPCGYNFKI